MRYTICQSTHTVQEICSLADSTGRLPDSIDEQSYNSVRTLGKPLCCALVPFPSYIRSPLGCEAGGIQLCEAVGIQFSVPIVCQQQWTEVEDVVYKTCIFNPLSTDLFSCWMGTRKIGLGRVKRLWNLRDELTEVVVVTKGRGQPRNPDPARFYARFYHIASERYLRYFPRRMKMRLKGQIREMMLGEGTSRKEK